MFSDRKKSELNIQWRGGMFGLIRRAVSFALLTICPRKFFVCLFLFLFFKKDLWKSNCHSFGFFASLSENFLLYKNNKITKQQFALTFESRQNTKRTNCLLLENGQRTKRKNFSICGLNSPAILFWRAVSVLSILTLFLISGLSVSGQINSEVPQASFKDYFPDFSAKGDLVVGWSECFESSGVSWRYLYRDNNAEPVNHERTAELSHSGRCSEKMEINFPGRDCLVLGHYIDYPTVLSEMAPSLWVRSDHLGITLGAVVVLPKTPRPDTSAPLTLLLQGSSYTKPGDWEKLDFPGDMIQNLQRMARAVRGEHKIAVDTDEAYIRQLVILVEGHGGKSTLWIDDLQIREHLPARYQSLQAGEANSIFDPINLLAVRMAVSKESIFPEIESDGETAESLEPFCIGSSRLSELHLTDNGKSREENYDSIRKKYYKLAGKNTTDLDLDYLTDPLKTKSDISQIASSAQPVRIGQVDYLMENGSSGQSGISAMNYSASSGGQSSVGKPGGATDLVYGSGTLPDASGAAAYTAVSGPSLKPKSIAFDRDLLKFDTYFYLGILAVEYQGEPLSFLKDLGFNAVWLKLPPDASLLQEAAKTNIWLIAPPPLGSETVGIQADPGNAQSAVRLFAGKNVPDVYDPVLVWDAGANHRWSDNGTLKDYYDQIKKADKSSRPVAAHIENHFQDFTRGNYMNLLLLRRHPILSSLDLCDYSRWLSLYKKLVIPGTPLWNEIQTQPDTQQLAQCRFFGAVEEMPGIISYEQMREAVRLSLAAGCHGLLFTSDTPLTSLDHETQYRTCALELINRELLMMHPWFGGSTRQEIVDTNNDRFAAAVLETKQTSLVLPLSSEANNQYAMGQNAVNNLSVIVPVRGGSNTELFTPGSLSRLSSKRRAGGILVELPEASMNSVIFLPQSEWYDREIVDKVQAFGPRMSELAIRMAKMRFDTYQNTIAQLQFHNDSKDGTAGKSVKTLPVPEQSTLMQQTQKTIREAENFYQNGDYAEAWLHAERATREIRLSERQCWLSATAEEVCRPVLPVSISFKTLPAYMEISSKIKNQTVRLQNSELIPGGDMEDPAKISGSGKWSAFAPKISDAVDSTAQVKEGCGYQGKNGLLFMNTARQGSSAPLVMDEPAQLLDVRFPVNTGQMICIQGMIKIPNKIENTVDGFFVYEDHGGRMLGLHFCEKTDWRPFAFYRYAAFDGEMVLHFSLHGYGQVWLDNLSAKVMK